MKMKKVIMTAVLTTLALCTKAQESQTVFNFLRLPVSAHASALGGDNVTLSDDDATLVFHNPALLNNVSDRTLGLNMMTYMQGAITGSASYSQMVGERGTWGLQGRFISYGEMKETSYDNQQMGDFSAKDFAVGGTFAYGLTDYINGGITAKMVASYIGQYNSLAAAIDLGLNYYIDLQVGVTKRLIGSPLRFSATLVRLNDWQYGLGKHFVLGADLMLSDQFYIAAGYNAMRAAEMKITAGEEENSHGAGLSLGAGMTLERLGLHVAYGKYHVSSTSLLINFSYTL